MTSGDIILHMQGITKTFPGVKALQDVNLDVRRGEIHAICGENGAGKSTLMKVLSGKKPEVNDTKTYDNKVKVVPTYLFQPTVVTKENYEKVLVDSGYYTDADLK